MVKIRTVVARRPSQDYCPLEVGDVCTIRQMIITKCCKETLVDVGIETIPYLYKGSTCPCGKTKYDDNVWWFNIAIFREKIVK